MAKRKIKIAVFQCSFVYSGGGERIVLEEVKGLRKRGYKVFCWAPALEEKKSFPGMIKKVKVKTFLPQLPSWFPARHAFSMIASSIFAPFLSWRFKDVDLFLTAGQPSAWIAFCCAKILGKPYITYLNQPNRLLYQREVDKESRWQTEKSYYFLNRVIQNFRSIVNILDKISFQKANQMLVNGAYMAGVVEQVYQRKPQLCPAGAYLKPFAKLKLNPTTNYKGLLKLGRVLIPKPFILITNRHEPQKKFEYVIQALKRVLAKYPHVFLVIPGPFTSYTPGLISLAKKLKVEERVLFLGEISEAKLQKLYQQAAVYCYPAPEEDFGLGPLEAGAWGVPTVAWNKAGPTVTVKNGVTGFLVRPFKVGDYAEKIIRLLKNPKLRAKMGKASWQRVKNQFVWEKHIDILEKEIKKLI
ncbi:MAG TPA: glycosyltransferase family 4 protein [Candidatus Bathyarchaeia archaeon]|nr:glycosyltransferase family 4 protein [Candidatus Bathyarchaeia archaeon]